MTATKQCGRCGETKSPSDYPNDKRLKSGLKSFCNACRAAENRRNQLRIKFNITPEIYDHMLAQQGGGCAICHLECPTGRRLAVDHDHATGKLRGLCCTPCNTMMGLAKDSPSRLRAAIAYLHQHGSTD